MIRAMYFLRSVLLLCALCTLLPFVSLVSSQRALDGSRHESLFKDENLAGLVASLLKDESTRQTQTGAQTPPTTTQPPPASPPVGSISSIDEHQYLASLSSSSSSSSSSHPRSAHNSHLLEFVESSPAIGRLHQDLTPPDLKNWMKKGDLASALGASRIDAIHIPIYVNVFALGFNKGGLNLTEEEKRGEINLHISTRKLARWLVNMDHLIPQNIVDTTKLILPQSHSLYFDRQAQQAAGQAEEHTNTQTIGADAYAEDDESLDDLLNDPDNPNTNTNTAANNDDPTVQTPPPSEKHASRILYRYHTRLIELSPKVLKVIERHLSIHYRPAHPSHLSFQVDPEIINGVLESLIKKLKLDDAYNLFVFHPNTKWLIAPKEVYANAAARNLSIVYGYRAGFSNEEIQQLLLAYPPAATAFKSTSTGNADKASSTTTEVPPGLKDSTLITLIQDFMAKELKKWQEEEKQHQAHMKNGEYDSSNDYTKDNLNDEIQAPDIQPSSLPTQGPEPKFSLHNHIDASARWADDILSAPHFTGPRPLSFYLKDLMQNHPEILRHTLGNPYSHEDCLVDNWIGRNRNLFLDLSAGPFQWGPTAAGEGIRSFHSFPSIRSFVSKRHEAAEALKAGTSYEDDYVDARYDEETIEAEKMLLADQLLLHECDRTDPPPAQICYDIAHKWKEIEAFEQRNAQLIQSKAGKDATNKNIPAPPMEHMDAFSFFSEVIDTDEEEEIQDEQGNILIAKKQLTKTGHDVKLEEDHFLSHLSASLSTSFHHVITPSVADTHLSVGYTKHVTFHLYVLANHMAYDPLESYFFSRLKHGLEQLRLPSQTFSYATHVLSMDNDPALSMAYQTALKSTVVPTLRFDGKYTTIRRLYVDSSILQNELSRIHVDRRAGIRAKQETNFKGDFSHRDIAIFLFSVDYNLPILVDKFYQSIGAASAGMVISVQSNLHLWETPLSCNGLPMYWNLRDPLRSILVSTAHVLGGLLPIHLKHSNAHSRTTQDWLWAVGDSPLALTSFSGTLFSQFNRDALHRNYIATAMRRATSIINRAIARLAKQKTTVFNRMLAGIDDIPLNNTSSSSTSTSNVRDGQYSQKISILRQSYSSATNRMQQLVDHIDNLQYDAACQKLSILEKEAKDFDRQVRQLIQWNHREKCRAKVYAIAAASDDGTQHVNMRQVTLDTHTTVVPTTAATSSVIYTHQETANHQVNTPSNGSGWFKLSLPFYLFALLACIGIVIYRVVVPRKSKPKLN